MWAAGLIEAENWTGSKRRTDGKLPKWPQTRKLENNSSLLSALELVLVVKKGLNMSEFIIEGLTATRLETAAWNNHIIRPARHSGSSKPTHLDSKYKLAQSSCRWGNTKRLTFPMYQNARTTLQMQIHWHELITTNTCATNNTNIVSRNLALLVVSVRAGSGMGVSGMECEPVPSWLWRRLWGTAGPLVWGCCFISTPAHATRNWGKSSRPTLTRT